MDGYSTNHSAKEWMGSDGMAIDVAARTTSMMRMSRQTTSFFCYHKVYILGIPPVEG